MTKKSFTGANPAINPAAQFISALDNDEGSENTYEIELHRNAPPRRERPAVIYRSQPMYSEPKSVRKQLILRPSLVKEVDKQARKEKISFNELTNIALQEYLNNHK